MIRALVLTLIAAGLAGAADEAELWKPYYISPRSGDRHLALDRDWELAWRDAQVDGAAELSGQPKWLGVETPASVQMALHRAGELPHPYYHLNSKQYRWPERKVWYYRKRFTVPEPARGNYAYLCFDGLDYFARIWLNGRLLGRHEGMYGGPNVEVSELLRYGAENEVLVELRSGNWGRWEKNISRSPGNVIRGWLFAAGAGADILHILGMWRGARLEIVPKAHLERPFLATETASAAEARLRLSVEVLVNTHSNLHRLHPTDPGRFLYFKNSHEPDRTARPMAVRLVLKEAAGGRVAHTETIVLDAGAGRHWVAKTFVVNAPKLWWPVNMGKPELYRAEIALLEAGRTLDRLEFDTAIRTIRTTRSAGPQTEDIWHDWQFEVNGRKLFVKGVNWMPADLLLDLTPERYEWLVSMARNLGIQMFRVWGGGLIETEEFYRACNRAGIMVWQDFTVSNMVTPEWPQDVWESQVVQNIARIRNHPSLALYCGGNESNPYHTGNAASIGIAERWVSLFDGTRPWRRTSPDGGSAHEYPDKDPTWYGKEYRFVPFMAETGTYCIPEARTLREVVAAPEFAEPLSLFEAGFGKRYPEFLHHFWDYRPARMPAMLSRASQIADMSAPTLEALAEAWQMGTGEFYQILSEQLQANYPATTGLLPWVYKRPWPTVAMMLADGFGQPVAPYYFLKRTYEPTHVGIALPELMWAPGEQVPIDLRILHAPASAMPGLTAAVEALDTGMRPLWKRTAPVSLAAGPSVTPVRLGAFAIPPRLRDEFFFLVAELRDGKGALVSRSCYWPRSLTRMEDRAFRAKYRGSPQPALTFEKGPWLKPAVAKTRTRLEVRRLAEHAGAIRIRVRNAGTFPAFPVHIDIDGTKRAFYAADNFFWLQPGEERTLSLAVNWREPETRGKARLSAAAWNAYPVSVALEP